MIDPGTNLSYRTLDHPETGSGELVEETRATVDPAARMKKLAVAGRLIMEGMPFIPLVKESKDFMTSPMSRICR